MAVEIFVGMYLFRILSIGPVGFILAFIVSVSQSIVDLFPTPEEAVHQFLWVWVALALASGCAWLRTSVGGSGKHTRGSGCAARRGSGDKTDSTRKGIPFCSRRFQ
jgi:hypothetical protein